MKSQIKVCVTGAGGFIGAHLVRRLKAEGYWVRGIDLKRPRWSKSEADEFYLYDLRYPLDPHPFDERRLPDIYEVFQEADWVFALAADMGGMGFISTKQAEIIRNNTLININSVEGARVAGVGKYLFTSSACVYPVQLQTGVKSRPLAEADVYPANPQMSYGWEKLHAEHLCREFREAGWLNTKIIRFHNCYGPLGSWNDGREKAPAALCRKVATAKLTGNPEVEIWGDGQQVRTYMYVDDCVEGLLRFMESDFAGPMNLGRDRTVTVDELLDLIAEIADTKITKVHVEGPTGVHWRNSDNTLCKEVLGWEPGIPLEEGLVETYRWIWDRVWDA